MGSAEKILIWSPLLVGIAATVCTIVIHGLMAGTIVRVVRRDFERGRAGVGFFTDLVIVIGATLTALVGHLVEIGLWAGVLVLCGEFSDFGAAFYHSAVNYTTLGYGDLVMSWSWRMLGPMEAADGMLMFGVSTAMIFGVIQRLLQQRFSDAR
jgi:Ion channel